MIKGRQRGHVRLELGKDFVIHYLCACGSELDLTEQARVVKCPGCGERWTFRLIVGRTGTKAPQGETP
jgi:DNA-directed RNA polymerase subunit RPC12/RpoP